MYKKLQHKMKAFSKLSQPYFMYSPLFFKKMSGCLKLDVVHFMLIF
ncbi:hypothetical protein bcere0021_32590 [Bacillus cereus Rock3-42]|nr:hypothetical protein bcere0021_32590 [Bacillus cereus Rock3-42]